MAAFLILSIILELVGDTQGGGNCTTCTWVGWSSWRLSKDTRYYVRDRLICCPFEDIHKNLSDITIVDCTKACRTSHNITMDDRNTQITMPATTTQPTTVKTTTLPTTPTLLPTTQTKEKKTTFPSTTSKATLFSTTTTATTTAQKTTTTAAKLTVQQTATSSKLTTSTTSKAKPTPIFPIKHSPTSTTTKSRPVSTTAGNATAKGRIQGPSGKEESSSNPLPGAIGGVIGVLVLAAIASGIFYFLWKRKKRGKDEKVHPSTPDVREAETKDLPMENGAPPSDHRV